MLIDFYLESTAQVFKAKYAKYGLKRKQEELLKIILKASQEEKYYTRKKFCL
jgi:hypothetical protein